MKCLSPGWLLTTLLLGFGPTPAAYAQFTSGYTQAVRGGISVDGWGEITTSSSKSGKLYLSVPAGSTIETAWLYTSYKDTIEPTIKGYPASLNGKVSLDGVDVPLTGLPLAEAGTTGWGLYRNDVTSIVTTRRANTTGDTLTFDITEAGDKAGTDSASRHTSLDGHALVVVYRNTNAPIRNLSVMNGAIFTDTVSRLIAHINLPGGHLSSTEAAVLAVSFQHEVNSETNNKVLVNTTTITSTAGGTDDGVDTGDWDGLWTMGSFGGVSSPTAGTPTGTDGDLIDTNPSGRDDELYNIKAALAAGATSFDVYSYDVDSNQAMNLVVFQGPANCFDTDGDTFYTCTLSDRVKDCDDTLATVFPGSTTTCDNVADTNCDGQVDEGEEDTDLDGYSVCEGDCDDEDGDIHPDAVEVCDTLDNNCNDEIDEGVTTTWYEDNDGDGIGDDQSTVEACEAPGGYVPVGGDPNDDDPDTYPGAPEICDGKDNDGNGDIDEGVLITVYADADSDTFGNSDTANLACNVAQGQTTTPGDCDDGNAAVNPGAAESCNGIDDDCDEVIDEGLLTTVYTDNDGDSFGDPASATQACGAGEGQSEQAGDCNDTELTTYPGAPEIPYDGVDNNCDGSDLTDVDDDGVDGTQAGGEDCNDNDATLYPGATEIPYDTIDQDCSGADLNDVDEDGFVGEEAGGDDCDDHDPNTYPGATEFGDGADNNCNGAIDEGLDTTDDDGDGFTEEGGDCNDNNAAIHPDATETCNGVDDNCNAQTDEGFDNDEDGHNDDSRCDDGAGDDCDDNDPTTYPGALELPDEVDNNCDGVIDEGTDLFDDDGDTFTEEGGDCNDNNDQIFPGAAEILDGLDNNCDGNIDEGIEQDNDGDGFTEDQGDCDDANDAVYPGAEEIEDGVDNNCDGTVDEGFDSTPTETPTQTPNPSETPSPTEATAETDSPTPTATPTEVPTGAQSPTETQAPDPTAAPTASPTPAAGPEYYAHGSGCDCDHTAAHSPASWLMMAFVVLFRRRSRV